LVRSQPFITEEKYLPFLKHVKAEREFNLIWSIAQQEKWINRDKISVFYMNEKNENEVIRHLIEADDFRSFRAGIQRAKPIHNNLVRMKADHAIKEIADLARKKSKLLPKGLPKFPCQISRFDANDWRNQMPFFDTAWMVTPDGARVSLDRKYLTAAHPSTSGWLAGYNLEIGKPRSILRGGTLVHFDNKTGDFDPIGHFSGPTVILPDRTLKLGQTTDRFWVIENWGTETSDVSAFFLNLAGPQPQITHMGALPPRAQNFTVAPNGDLLMRFETEKQVPIRLKPTGHLLQACAATRPTANSPAPN